MLPAYLRHVIRWGFASISRADWNGWLAGLTGTGLAGLARKGRDSVAETEGKNNINNREPAHRAQSRGP